MSSLANQLKRLRIPDNNSLERAIKYKKRISFLFDPKEASDIDNETVFAVALNGLDELKVVNAYFEKFEVLLFSESSKHVERGLQTQEVNDKLNAEIKDYLQFLSPYILLKPAHKTLEWLIRRFQIHVYNIDDLLACVFPYHQSNVFARVVQLINISNTKWSWLVSVQKTGSALPRSTVINHCISNPGFLSFISGLVLNVVQSKTIAGKNLSAFHAFATFYATTVIGVLEGVNKVTEEIVGFLLPRIIQGLKSPVNDLQAASYMIIGQLDKKCTLESSVIESILKTMSKNVNIQLSESLLMCINSLCSTHDLTKFPKVVFHSLCELSNLAALLCDLSKCYQMDPFFRVFLKQLVKAFFSSILDNEKDNGKKGESSLLLDLLRNMDIDETVMMDITRNVLKKYIANRGLCGKESDAVVKLNDGVKGVVRTIQNRWQALMDQTVQEYLVSLRDEEIGTDESEQKLLWTQEFVSLALSNIGSKVVADSGATLVVALHHPEAEFRKLALKKVSDILKEPMHSHEDNEFLKESLLVKLGDENPSVVLAVLQLDEGLIRICPVEQLVNPLIKLLEKTSKKWKKVYEQALKIILKDELLEVNLNENILIHLFPLIWFTRNDIYRAKLIVDHLSKSRLKSEWLVKSLQRTSIRENFEKCSKDSTSEEFAITNAMLLFAIAEDIAGFENDVMLKTIKIMQEHTKNEQNQTFLVMFLLICGNLLNEVKDDAQKFEIISLFLPGLLSLVDRVSKVKVKGEDLQQSDDEILENQQENCGVVPVVLITNFINSLKKKNAPKLKHVKVRIYLYLLELVVKCIPQPKQQSSVWWSCTGKKNEEKYTKILLSIFEVLLHGLGKGQNFAYQKEFKRCLQTVIKVQFPKKLEFLKFLTFLSSSGAAQRLIKQHDGIPVPSSLVVVQSLHIAQMLLKSLDETTVKDVLSEESQVMPSLIVCLTSPIMAVRQTVVQMISFIGSQSPVKTAAVKLADIVCDSSEEIVADENFIVSVFQRHVVNTSNSPSTPERRKHKSRKSSGMIRSDDVLECILSHIVNEETPSYIVRVLLTTLAKVVTKNFLMTCLSLMEKIINSHLKGKDCSHDHSQILLYLTQKFTSHTAFLLKTEPKLLEIFLQILTLSQPLYTGHVSPQEAILNQMSPAFCGAMTDEHIQNKVFGKMVDVLVDTSDPKVSAKFKEVLERIPISADQIQEQLMKLADKETERTRKTKKARVEIKEDWSSSLGPFWERSLAIIEILQTKDNVLHPENLLPVLFKILAMCLEMSEKSSLDYLRQLVLSTVSKICQTLISQGKVLTRGFLSEEHFSVEQIIHCIRLSGNPQTHHHALSLLAIGAQLFPEKVLHNIMSIFTFMGVSVLRQDDSYSFQVIKRTVEAVIPALIKADKCERDIQSLVIKVLRVFVDAFPHVPEHRRLPIFVHLLTTIGIPAYLHICLALLLEKTSNKDNKEDSLNNMKESGLTFSNLLCSEFSPEVQMTSLVNLLKYFGSLPEEKPEGYNRKRLADTSGIVFDVNTHSAKELHQFKLSGMDLILCVLGNDSLVEKNQHFSDETKKMDNLHLSLLEESLKYVTSVSRSLENSYLKTTTKYLRLLSQKVYSIVGKVSDLLPSPTFLCITSQLIHNSNVTIRRKAMELFNKRMVDGLDSSSEREMEMLLSVLDAVVQLVENEEETPVNKQSAFYTVIVLSRQLDSRHCTSLKKAFTVAIETFSNKDTKPQLASNALLCLAELCSVLKVHIIPFLPKVIPSVLKILEVNESEKRSDALLLSALSVVHKVIQSLPNFISPYLRRILTQIVSPTLIQTSEDAADEQSSWKKQILEQAVSLRADIAVLIQPRILIPNVSQCYNDIVPKKNSECIVMLFQLVGECVAHMSKDDVKNFHGQLLSLFITALDYRCQHYQNISEVDLLYIEETIIDAFLALIMRLSESLFRPIFLKLVDWATRSPSTKLRLLVFYHLADRMAEKLKGLFVLFAGYIIKNTASVLDALNVAKTEETFFADVYGEEEAVEKSCQLLRFILDCLYKCFLYDNQRFVNKERFDRLLKPLVDQIENQMGVPEVFHERITYHLAPCLAQFASAAGDEACWKIINHHVCLKTRHAFSQVRLAALKVVQELNDKLGEEYLTLLPEIIPFMAELMEDESFEVEQLCQQVISEMESVLGESLQKYF